MRKLDVALGERSYPIYIGAGLLDSGLVRQHVGKEVMLVSNGTVAPLYLEQIRKQLTGSRTDVVILPDGEQFKNLETLNLVFDALLERHHDRGTTLVALGGGVIGDMTGFAAACYQRGVNFVQIPTTLLAQVDSSVGGKTAVNHRLGKNMIGAFYQPRAVIIDTSVLSTLPPREFSAGLAEVVKYGLIRDAEFFAWLEAHLDALRARDSQCLARCIETSCRNKAEVVAADETETGMRAILNLGHTFGHAIETFTGYTKWLHGEAVATGMVMACDFSVALGLLDKAVAQKVRELLQRCQLPVRAPEGMTGRDFIEYMSHDKKVRDGRLRLVLLRGLGAAIVTADYQPKALEDFLDTWLAHI